MRKKILSINENYIFRRLYHRKAAVGSTLVTYAANNRLGKNRVGITTATKIGKAHDRSRARRVIREAYRLLMPRFKEGASLDIVFVARKKTTFCPMGDVLKDMEKHLSGYLTGDDKKDI